MSGWVLLNSTRSRRAIFLASLFTALVFAGTVQSQSASTDDYYQQGVKAYASGDYERAANIWLIEAYEGSADAQFNLGVMYLEGKGVGQSRDEAIFWFQKAAENGQVEAQYNLGHLLLEEKKDLEKVRQGVDWWRLAAENGFAIAQYNFARALFFGIGVSQDRVQAKSWFEQAATLGDQRSQQFLVENQGEFSNLPGSVSQQPGTTNDQSGQLGSTTTSPEASAGQTPVVEQTSPPPEMSVENDPVVQDIDQDIYVLVEDKPILAYTRFNTRAPIVGRISPGTLLRVVTFDDNWVLVQAPGGIPGWLIRDQVKLDDNMAEIAVSEAIVYADPTSSTENNDIGTLEKGARVLLLTERGEWVRILAPDTLPAWIEAQNIAQVEATREEIQSAWQSQAIKQKVAAMSAKVETNPVVIDSTSGTPRKISSFNDQMVTQEVFPNQPLGSQAQTTTRVDKGLGGDDLTLAVTVDEFVNLQGQPGNEVGQSDGNRSTGAQNLYRVQQPSAQMTSAPGADNVALFRIARGTLVDVIERDGDWARVSIPGGLPVWIPADQVEIKPDTVIVVGDRVRASAVPQDRDDIPVLGLLGRGMKLQMLDNVGDWIRVLAPEWMTAWIRIEDIESVATQAGLDRLWEQQKRELLVQLKQIQ